MWSPKVSGAARSRAAPAGRRGTFLPAAASLRGCRAFLLWRLHLAERALPGIRTLRTTVAERSRMPRCRRPGKYGPGRSGACPGTGPWGPVFFAGAPGPAFPRRRRSGSKGGVCWKRFFDLKANGTSVRQELRAGLTSFMAMCYLIFVVPSMLADAGMPRESAVAAVIWVTIAITLLMGLWARFPVGVAPVWGSRPFLPITSVARPATAGRRAWAPRLHLRRVLHAADRDPRAAK